MLIQLLQSILVMLAPFCPAATRTMLPVVCVLQTVVEVVLPKMLKDLTLSGPSLLTSLPVILLIIQSGEKALAALTLWTPIPKFEFRKLPPRATPIFGDRSRKVFRVLIAPSPVTLLFPIRIAVLAISPPPRILQLIIIILLSSLELLARATPTPVLVPVLRAPQLTQETIRAVFSPMPSENPLHKLAAILPAAFPLKTSVLTTGLLPRLIITLWVARVRTRLAILNEPLEQALTVTTPSSFTNREVTVTVARTPPPDAFCP